MAKKTKVIVASIVGIFIVVGLLLFWKNYTQSTNNFQNIKAQQYVRVETYSYDDNKLNYTADFDLKNNRWYRFSDSESDSAVLGKGVREGIWGNYKDAYKRVSNNDLSIFKQINTSKKQIRDSEYQLTFNMSDLVTEKDKKMKYPYDIQSGYYSITLGLKKIKVTYNKNYLPIRIDGFYDGKNNEVYGSVVEAVHGWYKLREFSYNLSRKEFNEEFNYLKKEIPEMEKAKYEGDD